MISQKELVGIIRRDLLHLLDTDIIYQYSSYDTALDEILLKKSLQFANPQTFNDPFDCNETVLKINIKKKSVSETLDSIDKNLPRRLKRKLIKDADKRETVEYYLKRLRKNFKVSCFSRSYEDVLLWSHYAKKHSGICIGFDFPPVYENKFTLCPIRYSKEIKEIDGGVDMRRLIPYWLTIKSERWIYEQEIRAIAESQAANEPYEYINYDAKYIKEVIFGCNVKNKKIREAKEKIKRSDLPFENIIFKRMNIDKETFLLKEETI